MHDPGISDDSGSVSTYHHLAVSCNMCYTKPQPKIITACFRDFRAFDDISFENDLTDLNFGAKLSNLENVDDMISVFNSGLQQLIDCHAPFVSKTSISHPNTSWYNESVRAAKQKKRMLERRWSKTGLQLDHINYRRHCASYNKLLSKSRNECAQATIEECQRDKAKLFKACKAILGNKKVKISLPGMSTDRDVANAFSDFFQKKVQGIRNELDLELSNAPALHPNTRLHCVDHTCNVPKLDRFIPVPVSDVKKLICKSNNKSCDLDIIPAKVMKKFADQLSTPINMIVNKSLESGIVPKYFKKAIVVPALKKPTLDPEEKSNFRPVSNLPCTAKITERVVFSQLDAHLKQHQLLSPSQSAYRRYHSTETMLVKVTNDILCALDKGRSTLLVALDVSACF